MPRGLRVDAPGFLQHVTFRGVEQRDIFMDDVDRWSLLRRLDRLIPELGFSCFAWVFMRNHVHLVLQTGPVALAKLMARLETGYALEFNRRHARVGHLFQDRYWSRPLEEDLETVVTYVHANPARAGLVSEETPHLYAWSGHAWVTGRRAARRFERMAEPYSRATAPLCDEVPQPAASAPETTARVLKAVCASRGIRLDWLLAPSRRPEVVAARREIVRIAILEHRIPGRIVAESLCVSSGAVSQLLRRCSEASGS